MAPLEPFEKVYVSDETFLESTHNAQGCAFCHGGDESAAEKNAAHAGLVKSPDESGDVCASCHGDIVDRQRTSLHRTTGGMKNALHDRWDPGRTGEGQKGLGVIFEKHCYSCHASCGDCHVNRPKGPAKGGLLAGHRFLKTPPEGMTCTLCHSARAGDEYYGQNPGAPADVHIRLAGMVCLDCHNKPNALHGPGRALHDRYENTGLLPNCRDCHTDVLQGTGVVEQHEIHGDRLQCNVCHSVIAKNCNNCHLDYKEEDGKITSRFFTIDPSYMTMKVGRNYRDDRPYRYIALRHPPTNRDLVARYGEGMLSRFDAAPTWKYAAPHNIQRITPQNRSCDSCHGNDELFLTKGDVDPGELKANEGVIVDGAPPKMGRD